MTERQKTLQRLVLYMGMGWAALLACTLAVIADVVFDFDLGFQWLGVVEPDFDAKPT